MQAFLFAKEIDNKKPSERSWVFCLLNVITGEYPLITFNKRLKLVFTSQKLNLVYALT
ncbi:hypothetical protein PSM_A1315 [Pseudoalteromonas sp. SM9913]|nr:hypothetical protein PSM_A1315 [Pseudoalteromonas sp. SM9913]